MPVVDKLEDPVNRHIGVVQIDLFKDGPDPAVAARVTREDGGEQLRRELGQIGRRRRRDKGKTSDFH